MSTVHFIFPTMSGRWPVSLYGVGAPVAPTYLYSFAKSIGFGRYDDGVCWDSSLCPDNEIIAAIQPGDLVCSTATVTGYFPSLEILRKAKLAGAVVAIGGPWVSSRTREIFRYQPWIDFVVSGEGEAALGRILQGRARSGVVSESAIPLTDLPTPDFSCWRTGDLRKFSENYRQMIAGGEYGQPPQIIPTFAFYQSARGCSQKPRCAFCGSRIGEKLNWRTAEQFHSDVESLRRQFSSISNRLHLFDTSDSFTSVIGRFDGKYTPHEGVTFTVFARADEIIPETAVALRQLGVTKVSIGIESGSSRSLASIGKNTTVEQNLRAVRLLADQGISVYVNFMYGIPGETESSLSATVDHVLKLGSFGNVYRAKGRVVTPLPRSRWFQELVRARPWLETGSDWLSPETLVRNWLEERTSVALGQINASHAEFVQEARVLDITYSHETAVWFG